MMPTVGDTIPRVVGGGVGLGCLRKPGKCEALMGSSTWLLPLTDCDLEAEINSFFLKLLLPRMFQHSTRKESK